MVVPDFGAQIRSRRNDLKITQPHLAALAEVSVNSISQLERGKLNPTVTLIAKLADVLGMELLLTVKKVSV